MGTLTVPPGGEVFYYFSIYLLIPPEEYSRFEIRINGITLCTAQTDQEESTIDVGQAACSCATYASEGRHEIITNCSINFIIFTSVYYLTVVGFITAHIRCMGRQCFHRHAPLCSRSEGGHLPAWGLHGGQYAWRGFCIEAVLYGTGSAWRGSARRVRYPSRQTVPLPIYGQPAGVTHPIGIQTCCYICLLFTQHSFFFESTGDIVQVVYELGTDTTPVNIADAFNGFTGFRI